MMMSDRSRIDLARYLLEAAGRVERRPIHILVAEAAAFVGVTHLAAASIFWELVSLHLLDRSGRRP